jgi:hypothetical protein
VEEEQRDSLLVLLADGGALLPLFAVDHFDRARATDGDASSLGFPCWPLWRHSWWA